MEAGVPRGAPLLLPAESKALMGAPMGAPISNKLKKVWKAQVGGDQCKAKKGDNLSLCPLEYEQVKGDSSVCGILPASSLLEAEASAVSRSWASVPSMNVLQKTLKQGDLCGLVELLLPGAEEYLRNGLKGECLSTTAEDKRQAFIHQLNALNAPDPCPATNGSQASVEVHPNSTDLKESIKVEDGEVQFCPPTPDSRGYSDIPTTVSMCTRDHSDLDEKHVKDEDDGGMEYEVYASDDSTEHYIASLYDEDELTVSSESDVYTPDPDIIPATVPLAAGPPTNWMKGIRLGRGTYGDVYQCLDERTGQDLGVVVKEIDLYNKKVKIDAEQEIAILRNLSHPRIVQCYGGMEVVEKDREILRIFMECMPEGSLKQHLERSEGYIDEREASWYTRQILEGLVYLHSQDIIHRDIKCANILMDENYNVKLGDLGAAKQMNDSGDSGKVTTFCGTYNWVSPEVVHGRGYGRKTDIWSLGCTILEMLTGQPPFSDRGPQAAIFAIGNLPDDEPSAKIPIPESLSGEAKDMIQMCLKDINNRPTASELLQHPFCSLYEDDYSEESTESSLCSTLQSPEVHDISLYW